MKNVLTIAGSDSCGGAGIQADLKTFSALGTYGMSAITAVTAQNTTGVFRVQEMDTDMVAAQISCIFEDIPVHAVKVGMVSSTEIIKTIAQGLKKHQAPHVVVDPVMVSKSKYRLLRPEACTALVEYLFPLAEVVTPNLPEAEVILNRSIQSLREMQEAAREIHRMGPRYVVIKGGHLEGEPCDVLYDGQEFTSFHGERVPTKNTHGTGCTFSSAIAAYLAQDYPIEKAIGAAKAYIHTAIAHSLALGHGVGPTNHFYKLYEKAGMNLG